MLEMAMQILGAVLVVAGGLFCFSAALGIVRFPDVFMRMHAGTKAGTLGLMFIAIGYAVTHPSADVVFKALLVSVFMIATAPIGSHLIGRAAFRRGAPIWKRTEIDSDTRRFLPPGGMDAALLDDRGRVAAPAPSETDADKAG